MSLFDPLTSVSMALRKDCVIPDVIPANFSPSVLFSVRWGDAEAMLGNQLTKEETQGEPSVEITPMGLEEDNPTFTLAMLDPDAPSYGDPKYGPFRHWMVSGLRPPTPGEVIAAASAQSDLLSPSPDPLAASTFQAALTPYRPPGPGPGTGKHRYVFLLFREPEGGYSLPPGAAEFGTELESRRKWSPLDFAKQNNLALVGANYFVLYSD